MSDNLGKYHKVYPPSAQTLTEISNRLYLADAGSIGDKTDFMLKSKEDMHVLFEAIYYLSTQLNCLKRDPILVDEMENLKSFLVASIDTWKTIAKDPFHSLAAHTVGYLEAYKTIYLFCFGVHFQKGEN